MSPSKSQRHIPLCSMYGNRMFLYYSTTTLQQNRLAAYIYFHIHSSVLHLHSNNILNHNAFS